MTLCCQGVYTYFGLLQISHLSWYRVKLDPFVNCNQYLRIEMSYLS